MAQIGDRRVRFHARRANDGGIERVDVSGESHPVATAATADSVWVWCDGTAYEFDKVRGSRSAGGKGEPAGELVAPMPGRVRRTLVAVGDRVGNGQLLLVLEAMKMEHAIRSPRDGLVRRLCVAEGELVEAGTELAEIV